MHMWLASEKIPRYIWVDYMLFMVNIPLPPFQEVYSTQRRCWSVLIAACRHPVCSNATLVLPLPCVSRPRSFEYFDAHLCFSIQESRWSVTHLLSLVYSHGADCLALIGQAAGETETSDRSKFRQIVSLKTVHLLAFFALVYTGVEVTIGGKF
jgi:hypothetical protein